MNRHLHAEYRTLCDDTKGQLTTAEVRLIAAVWRAASHISFMAKEYQQRAKGTPNEKKARRCRIMAATMENVTDSLEMDVLQVMRSVARDGRGGPLISRTECDPTARETLISSAGARGFNPGPDIKFG